MNAPIKQASTMLPNMPAEVFNGFLAPLINSLGWPFRTIYTPLDGTEWSRILSPLTLSYLSKLKWVKHVFTLDYSLLYPGSQEDIKFIILNKTEDVWASIERDSRPCRNSLLWHEADIMATRMFCAPVTIASTPIGLKILDGNHRIAALYTLGLVETVKVDAWIGMSPKAMA